MERGVSPLLSDLVAHARSLLRGADRVFLGITGAPGAGKTTFADALTQAMTARTREASPGLVARVPMDGFHFADVELRRLGRLSRKGAPDTFDVAGYVALLSRLRNDVEEVVYAPAFDRELEQPIAGSIRVPSEARLIVTEGNYLLADGEWGRLYPLLTQVWYVEIDESLRLQRLMARHIQYGKSVAEARAWIDRIDQRNADLITSTRMRLTLSSPSTTRSSNLISRQFLDKFITYSKSRLLEDSVVQTTGGSMSRYRPRMRAGIVLGVAGTLLATAACSGAGGGGGSGSGSKSISVLMVANPQMTDIQKLTADSFTKDTGIKVNYTVLPENELRDKVTQDIATQAGQYDVATIGMYEVPIWSKQGWLHELDTYADESSFDKADLIKPIVTGLSGEDGKLYGLPFYGESSFLMYRKDVFKKEGLSMPDNPTWTQVASLAAKVDGAEPGMKGICLRGLPGWGEMFGPLTTVVNTFGGTWFTKDWQAQVNAPAFKAATNFYVNLIRKHGEAGAAQAGFTECLNAMSQGKVAMWYDATSAAGSLEDPSVSKVSGKVGYVAAPVEKTKSSGWLWAWAWAMPKTTKKAEDAAKFMTWASSKDYEKLVGQKLGWARVPSGKRTSTYEIPEYKKAAAAFGPQTLAALEAVDPTNPGVQPRPTVGVQYVAIPEYQDLGTKVSQDIAAAITGRGTVDEALDKGQKAAEEIAAKYQGK